MHAQQAASSCADNAAWRGAAGRPGAAARGGRGRTLHGARDSGAMLVRVIAINFRLDASVRRLARNFSRLTGVPLARLLAPELRAQRARVGSVFVSRRPACVA